MHLIIGADHGAYELKEELKRFLSAAGHEVEDVGTDSSDSVDYPDYAEKLCGRVLKQKALGILLCGTGIGMSMAANKITGIRAALCHDEYTAKMAREHNDANVLCMGGRTTDTDDAKEIVQTFLSSMPPTEERHHRRVGKIMKLQGRTFK